MMPAKLVDDYLFVPVKDIAGEAVLSLYHRCLRNLHGRFNPYQHYLQIPMQTVLILVLHVDNRFLAPYSCW